MTTRALVTVDECSELQENAVDITEQVEIMYNALVCQLDEYYYLGDDVIAALASIASLLGLEFSYFKNPHEESGMSFEEWREFTKAWREALQEQYERERTEAKARKRAELEAKYPGMLPWSSNG